MANNVFTVRGMSFSYGVRRGGSPDAKGAVRIFEGLDLDIHEGIVTTLIGANGSGKSTLFNLLTKNLRPQAGSIFLRGGDVSALRLKDFAKLVAIVHQRNSAPGDLSVEKLVGYGRYPFQGLGAKRDPDEDERMVAWALETTGLAHLASTPVASLSGGQAQRAWIAMALAQGSKVLLLDEPTTYLDVRYQLDILRLVRRLNAEFGITVVMVLHDINQALCYSDEVIALADGALVAQGAPVEVVTPEVIRQVYGIDLDIEEVGGRPFVLAV